MTENNIENNRMRICFLTLILFKTMPKHTNTLSIGPASNTPRKSFTLSSRWKKHIVEKMNAPRSNFLLFVGFFELAVLKLVIGLVYPSFYLLRFLYHTFSLAPWHWYWLVGIRTCTWPKSAVIRISSPLGLAYTTQTRFVLSCVFAII